jgi:uncharacterized protein (TIGR03435 family)
LAFVLCAGLGFAQSPAFEVASVREITNGVRVMGGFESAGNRVQYHGFSVLMLALEAWNVRANQVVFAPGVSAEMKLDLTGSAGVYEIAALAPEGTTPTRDESREMLKNLLVSRFKLQTHTEKRDSQIYVLSVSGTPRLKPNTSEGSCKASYSLLPEGQRVVATHCPVQQLLGNLFVDRVIYDETGLTGFYDFEITSALPNQLNNPQAISPFSAVKDLGLKLEAATRAVETIVIDHVEGPGEN